MANDERHGVDMQGLSGAQNEGDEHTHVKSNDERVLRQQHILEPKPGEHGQDEGNRGEDEQAQAPARPTGEDKRAAETVERSPEPDRRDDAKVDRLSAPDWRSSQPLPSAAQAVDPRGINTPADEFRTLEERNEEQ